MKQCMSSAEQLRDVLSELPPGVLGALQSVLLNSCAAAAKATLATVMQHLARVAAHSAMNR